MNQVEEAERDRLGDADRGTVGEHDDAEFLGGHEHDDRSPPRGRTPRSG